MMMNVLHKVEWVAREIEVGRENLPQWQFFLHKSYMNYPGIEIMSPAWGTERPDGLSYWQLS
jgi:hypothetical protein